MARLIAITSTLIILLWTVAFSANIYVDPYTGSAPVSGATWDGVNGHSYSCAHGTGTGYNTIQTAILGMNGGDDIYIRGGTWSTTDGYTTGLNASYCSQYSIYIPITGSKKDGTSDNYSSLQSYPGEWAIIQPGGVQASRPVIGYKNHDATGEYPNSYWRFERLEIRNGTHSGIWLNGGPHVFRHLYIHDNYDATGGDNPGGIVSSIMHDSIIEYCLFDSNGASDPSGNNCAQVMLLGDYSISERRLTHAQALSDGLYDADNCMVRNVLRYNTFLETTNRATRAIKHKASQSLVPHAADGTLTEARKTWGDNIHHNLILGSEMIETNQDLTQVHHNIIPAGMISVGYTGEFEPVYSTIYNNYSRQLYYSLCVGTDDTYYLWDPSTTTCFRKDWSFNNIVEGNGFTDGDNGYNIGFRRYMDNSPTAGCYDDSTVLDLSAFYFKNNYLYRPENDNDVYNADLVAAGHRSVGTLSTWQTAYSSTMANNRRKATSETTDSLFLGTSGYSQYVMRGEHEIATGVTVADGGIGGSHPYLSGVTIPSYVGPTNPDSYSWVEQVNSFDVTYFTSQPLRGDATYDESWIEGSTPAPPTLSGVSASGVDF